MFLAYCILLPESVVGWVFCWRQSLRRKCFILGVLAIWAGFVSYAQKASDVFHGETKAWVRHTGAGQVFVTENSAFDIGRLLNDDGNSYTNLLVLSTAHNEWNPEKDGISGDLKVSAWTLLNTGKRISRWSFEASGNQGTILSSLGMFQVASWPCCSAPFENRYFSLFDGRPLYITNGMPERGGLGLDSGLVKIDGEMDGTRYTQTRFVGFGGSANSQHPSIQYGTDKKIKQQFLLFGCEYGDNFDVPQLSITEEDGRRR